FDTILLATGFDAVTGSIRRIDVRGRDGRALADYWSDGPKTAYGISVNGFPNLFILAGPHSVSGNNPRGAEHQVEWISGCIAHMNSAGKQAIEATTAAEEQWTAHAYST